jgi:hypothetical protein
MGSGLSVAAASHLVLWGVIEGDFGGIIIVVIPSSEQVIESK